MAGHSPHWVRANYAMAGIIRTTNRNRKMGVLAN
jgi:hypothetical protein